MGDKSSAKETKGKVVCDHCDKVFSSKRSLANHKRRIANEGRFKCKTCSKAFATAWNLKQHLPVHTKTKPFVCNVCDKAFARQGDLQLHARRHTGTKPFKCPDCGMAFVTSCELGGHFDRVHRKHDVESTTGNPGSKSIASIRHLLPLDDTSRFDMLHGMDHHDHHDMTATLTSHGKPTSGGGGGGASGMMAHGALASLPTLEMQHRHGGFPTDEECPCPPLDLDFILPELRTNAVKCVACDIDRNENLAPMTHSGGRDCMHPGHTHADHRDCWMRCKQGELHLHCTSHETAGGHPDTSSGHGAHHVLRYKHSCGRPNQEPVASVMHTPIATSSAMAASASYGDASSMRPSLSTSHTPHGAHASHGGPAGGTASAFGPIHTAPHGPTSMANWNPAASSHHHHHHHHHRTGDSDPWLPNVHDISTGRGDPCMGCEIDTAAALGSGDRGRVLDSSVQVWKYQHSWKYQHTCNRTPTAHVPEPQRPTPGMPHVPRFAALNLHHFHKKH